MQGMTTLLQLDSVLLDNILDNVTTATNSKQFPFLEKSRVSSQASKET